MQTKGGVWVTYCAKKTFSADGTHYFLASQDGLVTVNVNRDALRGFYPHESVR